MVGHREHFRSGIMDSDSHNYAYSTLYIYNKEVHSNCMSSQSHILIYIQFLNTLCAHILPPSFCIVEYSVFHIELCGFIIYLNERSISVSLIKLVLSVLLTVLFCNSRFKSSIFINNKIPIYSCFFFGSIHR